MRTGVSREPGLAPALGNVFVGDTDTGIRDSPGTFATDTELGAVVTRWRKGWGIQRHLDRLESWDCASLMKLSRDKGKVLRLAQLHVRGQGQCQQCPGLFAAGEKKS